MQLFRAFFLGGGRCLNSLAGKALSADKDICSYLCPSFELFRSTITGMNKVSCFSLLLIKNDN